MKNSQRPTGLLKRFIRAVPRSRAATQDWRKVSLRWRDQASKPRYGIIPTMHGATIASDYYTLTSAGKKTLSARVVRLSNSRRKAKNRSYGHGTRVNWL